MEESLGVASKASHVRTSMLGVVVVFGAALAACAREPLVRDALPEPDPDPVLTCERFSFRASTLAGPAREEEETGAPQDVLRHTLALPAEEVTWSDPPEDLPGSRYRTIVAEDTRVVFASGDAPTLYTVSVKRTGDEWRYERARPCRTEIHRDSIEPARWEPDGTPDRGSTSLPVLVEELACHGDEAVLPRLQEPDVRYTDEVVTIAFYVRPPELPPGSQGPVAYTCPGHPAERTVVELAEPLGDRALLDGGVYPPAPGKVSLRSD